MHLQAQRLLREVGLPNSYTLTKHMCEDLLAELHCKKFPVCITRPTIIGAIAHLPVPGYFGNAAGLTSATLAFATGIGFIQLQLRHAFVLSLLYRRAHKKLMAILGILIGCVSGEFDHSNIYLPCDLAQEWRASHAMTPTTCTMSSPVTW